ncbi:hypothetical protein SAMN05920897_102102 [Alkalispirochaeta americana]|uniref:SAP domain-containing protein n=1 Tax=Alkalispirochaeta americana TaxID=159291 RepID=A0A1N6P2U7_9SPIO|nr:LPS-assembly protein LptD [Alkalispirochaeta americana]SIP98718.1 hypothetical protein SAMN05920897_102102 [Alkalispirochaeta americana]
MLRPVIFFIVLTALCALVNPGAIVDAEEVTETGYPPVAEGSPETPRDAAEEDLPPLLKRTLLQDLETAEQGELLDWASTLGLSTRGSRRQIEDRILQHYQVRRSPAEPTQTDSAGSVLRIQRARGTRFFDMEQVDERTLRLSGGVLLTVEEKGVFHSIEAEEILINTDQSLLNARGNVVYTVQREDGDERFRGDSVLFQIDTWEGVFIQGVTESIQEVDQKDVTFFVQGEKISRSPGDILVVEGGTITSSRADPPNWSLKADRIWIFAPGEWGLRHAVLHVGRVPMFYFPYFFLPGDKLFFHPVAGSRTREGSFIFTTTYFYGEREESDAPFSIMSLTEAPRDSQRERQGLFLRIPDSPPEEETRPDWMLKVMADLYTRLGGYLGVAASMPKLGPLSRFDWRLGLGMSRNIYFENGRYSSYYVEEGEARQHWNQGFFLGVPVPFRYESKVHLQGVAGTVRFNLDMMMLSDTEFHRDFHDRSEKIDWGAFLSPSSEDNTSESATVNSINWNADLTWNPSVSHLRPWVRSLSISPARARVAWRSKADKDLPEAVLRPQSDKSPEEQFFYPQSVTFPDLGLTVEGELFRLREGSLRERTPSTDAEEERQEKSPQDRAPALRPPWEEEREEPDPRDDEDFRLPDRIGSMRGIRDASAGEITLTYRLNPTVRQDLFTDSGAWDTAEDVGLDWHYRTVQIRNQGRLVLNARSRDRIVTLNTTLSADQRHQSLEIMGDMSDAERNRQELNTYRGRSFTATQASQIDLFPLRGYESLESSSLRYSLSSRMYDHRFSELDSSGDPVYRGRWGRWDSSDITRHQTRALLQWKVWSGTQTLTATSDLPPRDRTYLGELRLERGFLTTRLSGGYRERNDRWKADNFVQNHTLYFPDQSLRLEQRLEHDPDRTELVLSRSTLRLGPLQTQLTGRRTVGYDFDPLQGWVSDQSDDFHWTRLTVDLRGKQQVQWWHRRVDLTLDGRVTLDIDLQRYTSSSLLIDYGATFSIHRFLDFRIAARSRNDLLYQYVPSLADEVERPRRNVLSDLADSLSLFDREAREETAFKIDSLSISAIHDLEDWELEFGYSGRPELETVGGQSRYEWRSVVTIFFRWRPVPEIKRNIRIEDGEIDFVD